VRDNVDESSGAKRKQNLAEHAEDARVSKRLATLHYDIDPELDIDEVMGVRPDRSRLREVAREFELRQVMQRLDEEYPDDIPVAAGADEIEVEGSGGTVSALSSGERALWGHDGRWAAADGDGVVAGEAADLGDLVAEVRERPLIAHDFK